MGQEGDTKRDMAAHNPMPKAVKRGTRGAAPGEPELGEWLVLLLVQGLPVAGLVVLAMTAMGQGPWGRKARQYARAALIFQVAGLVLGAIAVMWFAAKLAAMPYGLY